MTTRVGKQREIMAIAFEKLGGMDKLIEWSLQTDKYGNMINYGDFLKLYVKLVPPIKPDKEAKGMSQEDFIMSLIRADNILKHNKGIPKQIIEVDTIESTNDGKNNDDIKNV